MKPRELRERTAAEWEVGRQPVSLESIRRLTAPDLQAVLPSEAQQLRLAPAHHLIGTSRR